MSKSICALVHKPGSTREAFQNYYEESHAPLAVGLFPFAAYVRNHLVDPGSFGWDTISEFWAEDIGQAAALMDGPIGDTMRADEARFMDRSRIAPAGAEEMILSSGDRTDEEGRRTALLVTHEEGQTPVVEDYARSIAAHHAGVSMDRLNSWASQPFPANTVIWVPGWGDMPTAPDTIAVLALQALRVETPQSQLLPSATAADVQ